MSLWRRVPLTRPLEVFACPVPTCAFVSFPLEACSRGLTLDVLRVCCPQSFWVLVASHCSKGRANKFAPALIGVGSFAVHSW